MGFKSPARLVHKRKPGASNTGPLSKPHLPHGSNGVDPNVSISSADKKSTPERVTKRDHVIRVWSKVAVLARLLVSHGTSSRVQIPPWSPSPH